MNYQHHRRVWLAVLFLTTLSSVGVWRWTTGLPPVPRERESAPKPSPASLAPGDIRHVIVVVIDTLRADHMNCYGYKRQTSPFVDSLAAQGTVFEQAYSNSSYTCESVAVLFTGLLPSSTKTGAGWLATPDPSTENLPTLFKNAGYTTALFTNTRVLSSPEFLKGFAESYTGGGHSGEGQTLTAKALDFYERHRDEKTFVYVQYLDPHAPYEPAPEDCLQFAKSINPAPLQMFADLRPRLQELLKQGFGPGETQFEDVVARYDAEILGTDHAIKSLFDGMKRLGVNNGTLAVITSDHGEEFLDHGFVDHAWTVYQEVTRIPLIFWSPGLCPAQRRTDRAAILDILPTLLEFTRLPHQRTDLQGSPLFRWNGSVLAPVLATRPHISELLVQTRCVVRAVSDGGFKYVAASHWLTPEERSAYSRENREKEAISAIRDGHDFGPDIWAPTIREELYNIEKDPGEKINIVGENEGQRARLAGILEGYRKACLDKHPDYASKPVGPEDQERMEALRSGGYIK